LKIILVVNDDKAQAWYLANTILQARRYPVRFAAGCSDVLFLVQHIIPDLFLFDYRASPSRGIECLKSLSAMIWFPSIPKICMSENHEQIEREVQTRNIVHLEPPFEIHTLLNIIDHLLM
jgi:DNA-binding NtrC family response regulator